MIQPIGYFLTWRGLYSKPIWLNSTLEQQVILITLMAMANFKANEWEWQGEKFTLQAGQFITSLETIRTNTGGNVSIQNVRTALKRFEKLGFLTNQSTKTGRLITLVNWETYQVVDGVINIDANKDLTKSQQRPNKDLTPIEEGNKENKVNKEKKDNYKDIYDYYISLDLIKHRAYTNDIAKAIKKAMKDNKYDVEYMKVLLDRHKQVVEITKNNDKPVAIRGLTQFFGQKAYNATHLICSEYEEGGKLYETYLADNVDVVLNNDSPQSISYKGSGY